MQRGSLLNINAIGLIPRQSVYCVGLCSLISTAQLCSPVVFPEKRCNIMASKHSEVNSNIPKTLKRGDHRINTKNKKSDLLGYEIYSGKLGLGQRKTYSSTDVQVSTEGKNHEVVDVILTSKALLWGTKRLYLEDVICVSHSVGLSHFTIHSYPISDYLFVPFCFMEPRRMRQDFCFLASNPDEALLWVTSFANQQCYVSYLPHPIASSEKQTLDVSEENLSIPYERKTPPRMLVILNPRSGCGRSTEVFYGTVEPLFKLAGCDLEVVETISAGHASKLAATVDFRACPGGIVCVGGDGIVNEVINGLLSRSNQKEAISIPIGIIPTGSDNSLAWTVLGVRDPISAALVILKGGLTALDVLSVEWIHSGVVHYGMTASYFGFVSDVLKLSEKYQKLFGPFRYLVAGVLKFLGLPKYHYEVEYLPASTGINEDIKALSDKEVNDTSDPYTHPTITTCRPDPYTHIMRKSNDERVDPNTSPSGMSAMDQDTICSSRHSGTEPSEYVHRTDPTILMDNWKKAKGPYLVVLVSNHSCKSVQSLSSQVVAPKAVPDDGALDMLLVHGRGRLRLLTFFLWLQLGRHLSLPYVEYVKVKSVKIKPGQGTHDGCGIDGELFLLQDQVISSLHPCQCRLIGKPLTHQI